MTSKALRFQKAMQEKEKQQKLENRLADSPASTTGNKSGDRPSTAVEAKRYELYAGELEKDLHSLSAVTNHVNRKPLKETFVDKYGDFCAEFMASGKACANTVFVWVTIWLFDIGQIEQFIAYARHCIKTNQETPDRIKSTFATFLADKIYEFAYAEFKSGHSSDPYFSDIFNDVVTGVLDVPQAVLVKYWKLRGDILDNDGDHKGALQAFIAAQKADPIRAQVKTRIEHLCKQLGISVEDAEKTPPNGVVQAVDGKTDADLSAGSTT